MSAGGGRSEALITGDAVMLDLRPVSFAGRMLSGAVDGAVALALLIGLSLSLAWLDARAGLDAGLVAAGTVIASVIAFVAYPVLCEQLCRGRSLGRLVTGTRVVREDGGPVHARQSLLRAGMAMLEIWSTAGAIALTCAVLDRRSRRLGDLLAGTMVIQERMSDRMPAPVPMPPELRAWAEGADLGRPPAALVQEIRSFLPRAESTHPESRRLLVRDLVQRTLPHVAPAPPPGTDQEHFLAAVVAERAARDERRLRRAQERREEITAQVRTAPL